MDNPFTEIMSELVSIRKELALLKANLKDIPVQDKDRFIEIDEACGITCLKKKQVYHLCSTSAIPHYKNGKLYFKEQELIHWMNQKYMPVTVKNNQEILPQMLHTSRPVRKKSVQIVCK